MIDRELLNTILSIDNPDELETFLAEILTPSELDDLSLRWKLLKALHEGTSQREIARKFGISLCKITRGSRILKDRHSVVLKILNKL